MRDNMDDREIKIGSNEDFGRLYPDQKVSVDGNRVHAGTDDLGTLKAAADGGDRTFVPSERGRELIDTKAAGWSP